MRRAQAVKLGVVVVRDRSHFATSEEADSKELRTTARLPRSQLESRCEQQGAYDHRESWRQTGAQKKSVSSRFAMTAHKGSRTHLCPDRPNFSDPVHRFAANIDDREPALKVRRREGVVARRQVVAREVGGDVLGPVARLDEDVPIPDRKFGGKGDRVENVCRVERSASRRSRDPKKRRNPHGTKAVNALSRLRCKLVCAFSYCVKWDKISC